MKNNKQKIICRFNSSGSSNDVSNFVCMFVSYVSNRRKKLIQVWNNLWANTLWKHFGFLSGPQMTFYLQF